MIVDIIANTGSYRWISTLLYRGLDEMGRLVKNPLADGRHELAGSKLSAIFSSYQTEDPEEKLFEAHRRFIDIQVVLQGRETLYWSPLPSLELREEYSEADDIAFFSGPAGIAVPLEPGRFTILFPQDAHKPGCAMGRPGSPDDSGCRGQEGAPGEEPAQAHQAGSEQLESIVIGIVDSRVLKVVWWDIARGHGRDQRDVLVLVEHPQSFAQASEQPEHDRPAQQQVPHLNVPPIEQGTLTPPGKSQASQEH